MGLTEFWLFFFFFLGGHFVCKFFDVLHEFTADLVWLLYQLFDTICITKPLTSRPANSERYLVCKGLRIERPETLIAALIRISNTMETEPVESFINKTVFDEDEDFVDYIMMRNIR